MTQDQTRQLGIEFERRIQEIYPQFAADEKLDTDTIYSFLSEFQTRYVNELYQLQDQAQSGTRVAKRINDILRSLVKHAQIEVDSRNPDSDNFNAIFKFPSDYYGYIRSNSIINKGYKSPKVLTKREEVLSNLSVNQEDVPNILDNYVNRMGFMRNPMVVLESTGIGSEYIKVIHDVYTNIVRLDLTYYSQPHAFNIMNYDGNDTLDHCELPFRCFDELVTGAVDLYIQNYKFKLAANNSRQRKERNEQ